MDVYIHTVIAIGCMAGCYLWGRCLTKGEMLDGIITTMLDTLEKEGFIRTIKDDDGDMTLVPISEIEECVKKDTP
mgnify:CR=1 FL=1|jgi:hypothetical protein|tara:strand:+ start:321 stop:545 length:225 start_codon:yes stop_codon:yes gene_type:complete